MRADNSPRDGARCEIWTKRLRAVHAQQLGKPRTRAVDPTLHGADGTLCYLRRLVVGQASSPNQDESLALIGR